jgi:hypothetical protein
MTLCGDLSSDDPVTLEMGLGVSLVLKKYLLRFNLFKLFCCIKSVDLNEDLLMYM